MSRRLCKCSKNLPHIVEIGHGAGEIEPRNLAQAPEIAAFRVHTCYSPAFSRNCEQALCIKVNRGGVVIVHMLQNVALGAA